VIILLLLAGGLWFMHTRPVVALDWGPGVNIANPANGAVLDLGMPLIVTASGIDPQGVTRLELYVNGVLTAVQQSTDTGGSNPLQGFTASWTPTTAGRYTLTVRGYRSDGRFGDSSLVIVDVMASQADVTGTLADLLPAPTDVPCPSLNEVATALGVPVPDLLALNSSLSSTETSLPLNCAADITLPRPTTPPPGMDVGSSGGTGSTPGGIGSTGTPPAGAGTSPGDTDNPPSGGLGAPPVPATLPGTPSIPAWVGVDPSTCPSVSLTWTGSPDAEGFTIYRNAPGDSHMNAIAHLPASQSSYTDTISLAGDYYYQVAAVHGELEALSAIYHFSSLDFPACVSALRSPLPPAGSSLYLILPSLQTNSVYEGVYCYISVDGGAQGRLPAVDFTSLAPLSDGLTYDLRTPPARGHYLLTRTGSDPVTLEIRCMGAHGVYSDSLGGFLASHPSTEWDGHELISSGTGGVGAFTAHYCITADPTLTDCISATAPAAPTLLLVTPPLAPILFATDLPAPTNLRIGIKGTAACDSIPDLFSRLACLASALGGGNPQPQLSWDWNGAGPYSESNLTGYHIVATVNGSTWTAWDVLPGSTKTSRYSITSTQCGIPIIFQVTAVQGAMQSPPSAALSIPTPACSDPTRARVRVIFESLDLHADVTHGIFDVGDICIICRDNEFELSGWFTATTGPGIGVPLEWYGRLTGIDFVSITAPGVYPLADQRLSSDWGATSRTGNNIITLDLSGEAARVNVSFRIFDHDAFSSSQDCAGFNYSFTMVPSEWQTADQTIPIYGDRTAESNQFGNTDSIGCTVNVRFVGEPVP